MNRKMTAMIWVVWAACAPPVVSRRGAAAIDNAAAAQQALGRPVRLSGRAEDSKVSAVVRLKGGLVVHCLERTDWPPELSGRRVVVQGTLERSEELATQVSPEGMIAPGRSGALYVLRGCTPVPP